MEKLSSEDYRKVLGAIEILSRDIDYATFPERVVDAVTAVIDVDMISYSEIDLGGSDNRFLLKPDITELGEDDSRYVRFVRRFGNHPILAQKLSSRPSSRPDLKQFLDRIRMLGMVGNCCGDAELRLNMGMTIENAPRKKIGIALNRSIRDFDHRDANRLDVLKPHIVAAYGNAVKATEGNAIAAKSPGAIRVDAVPLTKRENEVLYDALEEAVDILKERRVDRMIKDRQEELKSADDLGMLALLQEIMHLTEAKKRLAKKTGRVIVG